MDKLNTKVFRDRWNKWTAETTIQLGDNRQLDLYTHRNHHGLLITNASVGTRNGPFVTHKLYQDFSGRILTENIRATKKNVASQHQRALGQLEQILDAIKVHYAPRAA